MTDSMVERVARAEAEIVKLRALVRRAYNEGFGEGTKESRPSGGKPWMESRTRAALDTRDDGRVAETAGALAPSVPE